MDELKGPSIQIVLNIKEGLGFGFLRSPFSVSGSLNGYILETDPVIPSHAPVFDAELVWEADKRRFRSLRLQNVPVKIEVFTTHTEGKKEKVGYLLMSLLGAQPCPASRIVEVKHSWHRLLGVKSEGKCCHPQLLLSLSIEDRVSTPTPRNELRMFHTNEKACPASAADRPAAAPLLLTSEEYRAARDMTVTSPDLQPRLVCEEGLIEVGGGSQLFVLGIVIASVENIDLLLSAADQPRDCYVSYSVFTHNVTTDRVNLRWSNNVSSAQFNQRTSLRLRSELRHLRRYWAQCPHLVTSLRTGHVDLGICSMDLRRLVPTEHVDDFVTNFCNEERALTIHERCFLLRCDTGGAAARTGGGGRRPYVDVQLSLEYAGVKNAVPKCHMTSARSAIQLRSARGDAGSEPDAAAAATLRCRSGSDTQLHAAPTLAYTSVTPANTSRYKDAAGDTVLQTSEIVEMIRKMYESFTQGRGRGGGGGGTCAHAEVQAGPAAAASECAGREEVRVHPDKCESRMAEVRAEGGSGGGGVDVGSEREARATHQLRLDPEARAALMQKYVEELEDWKEKQQDLYKCQLNRKEEYHLEQLSKEWSKRRAELESRLSEGVEQCRRLAEDLSRATDEFRLKGFRNAEREKKLLDAKKALEAHYTTKYQELREASQKMEDDMNHRLKMNARAIEELQMQIKHLQKQVEISKNELRNKEKAAESRPSGLTKDQTASLIQELHCLEEKLDSALQSKAFFKEQWGRAVRELHLVKLDTRRQMLQQLRHERRQLADPSAEPEDGGAAPRGADAHRSKDDFYVDLLANTPPLDTHSALNAAGADGPRRGDVGLRHCDVGNITENSMKDKLGELIARRDELVRQESPDEDALQGLNREIRSMLVNCRS